MNVIRKKGEEIAKKVIETLKNYEIPLSECRGQGYDNASNMKGQFKGVQARIIEKNPLAMYSPCGAHSLNLCGVKAAASCEDGEKLMSIL